MRKLNLAEIIETYNSLIKCPRGQANSEKIWSLLEQEDIEKLCLTTNNSYAIYKRLSELSFDNKVHARCIVDLLRNPSLPSDIIDMFVKSNETVFREYISKNESLSEENMVALSTDLWFIARSLARNLSVSTSILCVLSKSRSPEVRQAVVENDKCPDIVLSTLIRDEDLYVRGSAIHKKRMREFR